MKTTGIQPLDPKLFPREYYKLKVIAKATGLTAVHLRGCALTKKRFGNADYLRVEEVNRYIEDPASLVNGI